MAQENKSKVSILTNGIIKENPVLRLVLGTCSILAVTTAVSSALGMGAAFTFVLVCSNIMISLLRKVIPGKVHLPCYIVIIAGFVTIVQMFMQAYMESLYNALGVFLPLIVVNCIILGRAEMFACKNNVVDSALDGVGMGLGYTLTATLMASIREILGSGTWLGFQIIPESVAKVSIMTQAPGAFFCYGILMAGCIWLEGKLDDLEQQVLQALSEVEIPNTWLEEWEKFTNSAPESGEREIRKWVETQLGKLKGFEALDQLEQNQIASLYQDALLFSREILSRKEQLGGTLTDEERDVLNYIQNSIR